MLVLILLAVSALLARCLIMQDHQSPSGHKLVLIGVDTSNHDLLKPMVKANRMPNLELFMEQAAYGRMRTNVPQQSSPLLWATVCTGVGPLVHGVSQVPWNFQHGPVPLSYWNAPALWDILGATDLTSAVIGNWATHPARPINGVMVSDYLPYRGELGEISTHLVYPDSLSDSFLDLWVDPETLGSAELSRFIPAHLVNECLNRFPEQIRVLQEAWATDLTYFEIAKSLASREDFDLFCFYLRGPNLVSRAFYPYMAPRQTGRTLAQDEIAAFAQVVPHYYEWVDEVLGEIFQWFSPARQTAIIWDHGFSGPMEDKHKETVTAAEGDDGVYMVRSPLYLPGCEFEEMDLFDVCPTLLSLMRLPPGRDMPGQIFLSGVTPQGGKRFLDLEKKRVSSYMPLRPVRDPEQEKTSFFEEELRKELEALDHVP